MGMMFANVTFEGHAPPLSVICARISEICSLPVVVLDTDAGDCRELDATIAFECNQELTLQLTAYRQGAVAQFCDETFDDASHRALMKNMVQGANEPAGTQTVYLRGYIGQEPTLMATTEIALQELGGTPSSPVSSADRNEYGRPVTEAELQKRCDAMHREFSKAWRTTLLALPVLIPLWILACLWSLVTMPYRILRNLRVLQQIKQENEPDAA